MVEKVTLPNGLTVDFLDDNDVHTMTKDEFEKHKIQFRVQMRKFDLHILKTAKETLAMAEERMKDILRFVKGRIQNKRAVEEDIFYRLYYYARRFFNLYESMLLWRDLRRAKKDFYLTKNIIWSCRETIEEINQTGKELYGLPSENYDS